ncbi:MAG: hypothetical protein M3325_03075, partial [Actinomycetota bacterium]|nr:hypothetical protein [Actinomycetota bacterium]
SNGSRCVQGNVHADHAVPICQLADEPDELAPVAVMYPAATLRLLNADTLVESVECGIRPNLPRDLAEVAVSSTDI